MKTFYLTWALLSAFSPAFAEETQKGDFLTYLKTLSCEATLRHTSPGDTGDKTLSMIMSSISQTVTRQRAIQKPDAFEPRKDARIVQTTEPLRSTNTPLIMRDFGDGYVLFQWNLIYFSAEKAKKLNVEAKFIEGNWASFVAGEDVKLELTESGKQALEEYANYDCSTKKGTDVLVKTYGIGFREPPLSETNTAEILEIGTHDIITGTRDRLKLGFRGRIILIRQTVEIAPPSYRKPQKDAEG